RYLSQEGNEPAAETERALARMKSPVDDLDFFLLGEDAFQKRNLPEAIRNFNAALAKNPRHYWARYYLAVCHMNSQQRNPAQARDNLTACVGQNREFLWAYLLRAFAHTELGEFAAAENDFQEALKRKPDLDTQYGLHLNRSYLRTLQARAL